MTEGTKEARLPDGDNGRDASGRFAKGNPGGTGNPYARRVAELRSALLDAVTPADIEGMARAVIDKARDGDVVAFRAVAPYLFGKPLDENVIDSVADPRQTLQIVMPDFGPRYMRLDGSIVKEQDPDWPAELEAKRYAAPGLHFDSQDRDL
ncbi:MAG: hypothetical protein WCQ45_01555 [bacterium]